MSPTFFEALDIPRLFREYPTGRAFPGVYRAMSADELRAIQERRFLRVMRRGWATPFYRRLWGGRVSSRVTSPDWRTSGCCPCTTSPTSWHRWRPTHRWEAWLGRIATPGERVRR